jgi:hypothetical protein
MRRRPGRERWAIVIALAIVANACGEASLPTVSPSMPSLGGSPTAAAASHVPGVVGRDWGEAGIVPLAGGDPMATTPPYVNPGSLGHPQAYQGGQADLLDVASAGGTLVAVGYLARDFRSAAWFSTDGLVWAEAPGFPADESSVAAAVAGGAEGFATVGGSGPDAAAWISTDGRLWRHVSQPAFHESTQIRMTSVAAWHGGYVAAGYLGSLVGPIRAAFWTSPDAETWDRVADDAAFADARVTGLAAAPDGSRLVAVGGVGDSQALTGAVAWQSIDGTTWQRTADTPKLRGTVMNAVTWGSGGFVAVGSDVASVRAVAWTSADGTTWTEAPDDPGLDNFGLKIEIRDVTATESGYLAGGHFLFGTQYPSAAIWTSPDGVAWTRVPDAPGFSQGKVQGVVAGGPGLVAVGSFGSPDVSVPTVWISPPP